MFYVYIILHNRDNSHNTAVTNPLYCATSATNNKADMTQSEYKHDDTKCNDNVNKEQTFELKSRASSSAYQNIIQNLYDDDGDDDDVDDGDDDDVSIQSKDVACDRLGGNVVSNAKEMRINSNSLKSLPEPKHLSGEVDAAPVTDVQYDMPGNINLQPTENNDVLGDATQRVDSLDTTHTGENGYEEKVCESPTPPGHVIPRDISATS